MSTRAMDDRFEPNRVRTWCLSGGAIALIVCIVGAFFDPAQFFRSYLAAYLFYQGIGLGCLVILMIYYLTGGAWGFLIRRFLEAGTRTLPLLALLLIPVGCGLSYLFAWARPAEVAADPNLQWKQVYLNVPFWWGRAVLFFAVWLGLAYFLNSWSRKQEQSGELRYARRLENLSGPGLVAYGICIHFAAVDWIMSLQTTFKSSIFGPLMATGQILTGMGLVLAMLAWMAPRPALGSATSVKALTDLGNLLLAVLIIWAYMVFFQFMLIWIANLPHEVIWYLDRSRGGWQWVAWGLFLLHFAVPFFLLLLRALKGNAVLLAYVAGTLLFMHLVFLDWQILPAFFTENLAEHWMDFLMPVGLGGIWFGYYLWQLQRYPLLPMHDENRTHALRLRWEDLAEAEQEAAMSHG
ncbi:MAG TPA: hypothetical protein VKU02_13350 [Gemmataceae bacterium]|nr:hypothetical protein [Gemmataceae bacterium]